MSATTFGSRIDLGARSLFGRAAEQGHLLGALESDRTGVLFLHGLAGIGKTSLLEAVSTQARRRGLVVVRLDGSLLEPTAYGFNRSLAIAVGADAESLSDTMSRLGRLGPRVVLVIDTFELLRLLDDWVRLDLLSVLPPNVKLLIASRERPHAAWWRPATRSTGFDAIELGPLDEAAALAMLEEASVPRDVGARLNRVARGHPLALRVAAGSIRHSPDPELAQAAIDMVVAELTRLYTEGADSVTRRCLEAASVVRRITRPLLEVMLPDTAPVDAYERLSALPFVQSTEEGLRLHELVQRTLSASFRAADPDSHRRHRRVAYAHLRTGLREAPKADLWRFTADTLFLLDNPAVREAFFPTTAHVYSVEQALATDALGILEIANQHSPSSAAALEAWWTRMPAAFRAARGTSGDLVGFYLVFQPTQAIPSWLESDQLGQAYWRHLRTDPIPRHQTTLFVIEMLAGETGGKPSPVLSALWLDLKRMYVELRPRLRRIYSNVEYWDIFGPVLTTVGFQPLAGGTISLGNSIRHPVVLDFGPSSVDGWLSWLLGSELGVEEPELLDRRQRQLVLDGRRIDLTRQEFEVMQYLSERRDRVVTREELLSDVWGHAEARGSNVVDATIRLLRDKLGRHSSEIETVRGLGYRFRG